MFETFPRLTSLFDPIAGRRTFTDFEVRDLVIATPERTIVLAEVASVSVGVDERWPIKIALLVTACVFAAGAVFLPWLALFAVLLVVSAVFVRATSTLAIATNDGSRTYFSSATRADLDEAMGYLTERLNGGDVEVTRRFQFAVASGRAVEKSIPDASTSDDAAVSQPAAVDTASVEASPDEALGDATAPAPQPTTRDRLATSLSGAGGGVFGRGRRSLPSDKAPDDARDGTTQTSRGHVDYASVLAQVTELHRFYAKTPDTKHIEQRLSEMEVLMRSGTPTEDGRERVRQLAGELASIMQAYPPMVQLFQNIATLATPPRSAAA